MSERPIAERLFGNVERLPWSGCWIWMGSLHYKGYGELSSRYKRTKKEKAHRVAWEVANGKKIPYGLQVCHSCDVKSCINPAHLWLGTNQQNAADAGRKGFLGWRGKLTNCKRGHLLSGENIWTPPSGGRMCKTCKRNRLSELEGERTEEKERA